MASIVLQLQQDALDRNVPVTDLLRKALVVARKLQIGEFETWIMHELDDYREATTIPPYRHLQGQVKGWNPFHGWLPVHLENADHARRISARPTPQRIAEIEHLVRDREGGELSMPFNAEAEAVLHRAIGDVAPITAFIPSICSCRDS